MKRYLGLLLKGAGMGAADAVPGVSGGTIAFVTGIYEELIHTINRFGPGALGVWRRQGWRGLLEYLNLSFLLPLLSGIAISLVSVAHLVVWLMETQRLLLDGFFFGLVAASALVVGRHLVHWHWWHVLPMIAGILLAQWLPALMPLVSQVGSPGLVLALGGAIAICAMLLPGVSGSFLLLSMGLYGTVMEGIRSFDIGLLTIFAGGCLVGLLSFSRLLSWLLDRFHTGTLLLLTGFILGSLPVLWPWRQLASYQLSEDGRMIPLEYQYLTPGDFHAMTGESAQLVAVLGLMLAGGILVLFVDRFNRGGRGPNGATHVSVEKE